MAPQILANAICTFCGCLCDDVRLTVGAGRVVQAQNACALGKAGFGAPLDTSQAAALIDGREATWAEALEAAAQLLLKARFPLVYGLSNITCEAQRQAVALAELIGASLDLGPSAGQGDSLALQSVGANTATLGEVKNRADLVIYWGANPARSHPRHLTRYAVMPRGLLVPNGRQDRTVILVDAQPTATLRACDLFIQIKPECQFEAFWALRAILRGLPLSPTVEEETGVALGTLRNLGERMQHCRYGAIFYGDGLTQSRGQHFNIEALLALVAELNEHTPFVALPLAGHGNLPGAENVLAWQTGYPLAVNFARGYPRYNPGEFSAAELLARGEVDAALIVASDPTAGLPAAAAERLSQIPSVVLNSQPGLKAPWAQVAFTTASFGLSTSGTVYRMDEVPLALRPALPSPYPSAGTVLSDLCQRVIELAEIRLRIRPAQLAALAASPSIQV